MMVPYGADERRRVPTNDSIRVWKGDTHVAANVFSRLLRLHRAAFILSPRVGSWSGGPVCRQRAIGRLGAGPHLAQAAQQACAEPLKIKFLKPGSKGDDVQGQGAGLDVSDSAGRAHHRRDQPVAGHAGMLVQVAGMVDKEGQRDERSQRSDGTA